jgi:glycosyltransferase involved in cell wall biosynthesis
MCATGVESYRSIMGEGLDGPDHDSRALRIAYLLGMYPATSQTFIRNEIGAVEASNVSVSRYTLRRWNQELIDPADVAERQRTRAVLDVGAAGLLLAFFATAIIHPGAFLRALKLAFWFGLRSERGLFVNLVYLGEACILRRWFRQDAIEHVHTHFATDPTTVALLCRVLGGPPFSITVHGPEEFDKPLMLCLGAKIRHARFVIAISEFTRSQLYRWVDYRDWSKIRVIHVGVSPMFLNHGPAPIPTVPRLVNIGRIVEQKGQAILVHAAAQLQDRGFDFELVIVGDGAMRGQIECLIDQLGLRGRVRITGYLSNWGVLQELLAARALVLPSFAEGLPVVFFEAMAVGRPVISTSIAAHAELIEPGVNGWLVPAGAVEPLVDAMIEALTADPVRLEQMGRAGALRVVRQHDVSVSSARLVALIHESRHLWP